MKKQRTYNGVKVFLLGALFLNACATPIVPPPPTRQEILIRDFTLGHRISKSFEKHVIVQKNTELEQALEKVAQRLAQNQREIKDTKIQVKIIQIKEHPFEVYSVPGTKIYITNLLLKQLKTESELAAVLAFQMSHIDLRSLSELVEQRESKTQDGVPQSDENTVVLLEDYFSAQSIFNYPQAQNNKAIPLTVKLLYASGYDARSLVQMWEMFLSQSEQTHYSKRELNDNIFNTRTELKKYSPLRNPVVQSDAFTQILEKAKKH